MKFGRTLRDSCVPGWQQSYVDYQQLKRLLKQVRVRQGVGLFTPGACACASQHLLTCANHSHSTGTGGGG